ncbi:MAG TPA: ABC transporter permease [Aeromicrobium sp.]|nr:ABC transporter permease [Aeromicrobium sp.]
MAYLRDVWRRRQFIYHLARYRIEAQNGQNRLGMAWVLLKPIIDAVVYGTIFGLILMRGNIPHHYILFLIVGVFMFDFFSSCFTAGSKSITRNANLVQSLAFPRMALPLALVTEKFLEFIPMLAIIFATVLAYGVRPEAEWLLMIPVVVLFTIFNTGVTMFTARLTVHFQDLTQLLPFVSRLLFYSSGVFYSMELRFGNNPTAMRIVDPQPIHEFLSLGRAALLDEPGFHAKPEYWLYASIWAVVSIIAGSLFFWAAEERYGRVD